MQRSERSKTNISVLCRNILSGNMCSMPQDISPQCQDLIFSLLQQQPSDRPSIVQVSEHAWLSPNFLLHPIASKSHWVDQPGNNADLTMARVLDKGQHAWADESSDDVISPDNSANSSTDIGQLQTADHGRDCCSRKHSSDDKGRDKGKRRHCRCRHRHGHSRRASHAHDDSQQSYVPAKGVNDEPWMQPLRMTAVSFTGGFC